MSFDEVGQIGKVKFKIARWIVGKLSSMNLTVKKKAKLLGITHYQAALLGRADSEEYFTLIQLFDMLNYLGYDAEIAVHNCRTDCPKIEVNLPEHLTSGE